MKTSLAEDGAKNNWCPHIVCLAADYYLQQRLQHSTFPSFLHSLPDKGANQFERCILGKLLNNALITATFQYNSNMQYI